MQPFLKDPNIVQYSYNTNINTLDKNNNNNNMGIHDLAYLSAYNYDKTFNSNPESMKYLVSKEDYLLLQKIKKQQLLYRESLILDQENGPTLPSRGVSREVSSTRRFGNTSYWSSDSRMGADIQEVVPKLPPRKQNNSSNIDPYEERFKRYTKTKYTTEHTEEETKENDDTDERNPRISKRTIDRFNNFPTDTSNYSTIYREARGTNLIDISESDNGQVSLMNGNNKPNPVIKTNLKPIDFLDSLQNKEPTLDKDNNHKSVTKVSKVTTDKHLDYLESLQQNPNTTITIKKEPMRKAPVYNVTHLDYLDSVQENSSTVITKHQQKSDHSNSIADTLKMDNGSTKGSKSESFIESALKKSESTYSLSLKKKPLLPIKPATLANFKINSSPKKVTPNDKRENPNIDDRIQLPQLRRVGIPQTSKMSPKKTPIQEYIDIPELKSVKKTETPAFPPINRNTKPTNIIELPKLKSVEKDKAQLPPVNKDTKPKLPEALIKHADLKTKENFHDRHMIHSKTAPAIPARKISMPEALRRAKELKENRNKKIANTTISKEVSSTFNDTSNTKPVSDKPLSIEDKLSRILVLQKRHTVNDEYSSRSSTSTSVNSNPFRSTSNTSTPISSQTSTSSLNHPTKGRSKGPKRKLPTKMQKS